VTEGSGAAGVAAVLNRKIAGIDGKQVCVVLTGVTSIPPSSQRF